MIAKSFLRNGHDEGGGKRELRSYAVQSDVRKAA
jgi:hypothetical protein